ncbi:Hypothetical predicted protein [Prunus dulcis]|uniref:Uncharacterized protein n=1 Tax=Prunus dulcis TaxID=3755 RepID=A0A5E4FGF1_PRUDU|nr:Hypothetical predicted protein [Prunus dulcis]
MKEKEKAAAAKEKNVKNVTNAMEKETVSNSCLDCVQLCLDHIQSVYRVQSVSEACIKLVKGMSEQCRRVRMFDTPTL